IPGFTAEPDALTEPPVVPVVGGAAFRVPFAQLLRLPVNVYFTALLGLAVRPGVNEAEPWRVHRPPWGGAASVGLGAASARIIALAAARNRNLLIMSPPLLHSAVVGGARRVFPETFSRLPRKAANGWASPTGRGAWRALASLACNA